MRFVNRKEAGQLLAAALQRYKGSDVVVYALPRGGVVLGAEVAKALHAPLDLVVARKIGHPMNPEYAVCAVSESGYLECNPEERAAMDPAWLERAIAAGREEAQRRRKRYLDDRQPISATGKTAILVDDGIATGLTMFAAIDEIKAQHPKQIIVAVPVIPPETNQRLEQMVDAVVALEVPALFLGAVGAYYEVFTQVSDEEVIRQLQQLDSILIFAFSPYQRFENGLLQIPGTEIGHFSVARFANGELYIDLRTTAANNPCIVIGTITPPDTNLTSLSLLCHTLAQKGAAGITAVLPYLAYMRQDKPEPGRSRAASWIGEIFHASHIAKVITVDIHSQAAMDLFPMPVVSLSPAAVFAQEIRRRDLLDATLVAPDEGALDRCEAVRRLLGNTQSLAHFHKERTPDGVRSSLNGEVGKRAIIIDDILDTGSTLIACCEALRQLGVMEIMIFVTHGLFTGTAWQRLWSFPVKCLYCTDTVPIPADLAHMPISVLSIQPVLENCFTGKNDVGA